MESIERQLSFDEYLDAKTNSVYKAIYTKGKDMFSATFRVPKGTADFILRLEAGKRAPNGYKMVALFQKDI